MASTRFLLLKLLMQLEFETHFLLQWSPGNDNCGSDVSSGSNDDVGLQINRVKFIIVVPQLYLRA